MSILEIILLTVIYILSSGLIALALLFGSAAMRPVFKNIMTFGLFVPGVNCLIALLVSVAFFETLITNGKEKGSAAGK